MIALAAILVGCSSQPPHLAASESCTDKRVGCFHSTAPHHAYYIAKKAKPASITAKTEATTRIPPPSPSSRTQIEPKSSVAVTDVEPTMGLGPNFKSSTIQEQVAAATGVAEQMTAAALAAREPIQGEWPNKSDRLVAIVMSRPEVKSLTDLAGKKYCDR